ncbi:Intraflagellar transport protein 74 [Blomia tropicalis]|nr:Intraflagellar transport protein 74 [Blomia tropicalis]
MDSAKTGLARPISTRPLSSARAMTNTGLIAPKSSRGKTALRRQIQDKSYFIGLLRSKINEINNEKNVLMRECDIMGKEEARIGVYRQKAETLAKELNDLNLDLITYNEFIDRIRMGDDINGLRNIINDIKNENEILTANLENDFSQLKNMERIAKANEEELQKMLDNINTIKSQFTIEQRAEYESMQSMNEDLGRECLSLKNEIEIWNNKKSAIESKITNDESIIRMEMLQLISKLRHLERQKNELINTDSSEENERGHLLAQVKRDNAYISNLESKIEEYTKLMDDVNNEIEFYRDGEKVAKFSDLKQKEKMHESFMTSFTSERDKLLSQTEVVNNEINDMSSKLSRALKYLAMLQQIGDVSSGTYNILNELIIQKRKLELDLYKIRQQKIKAETDKDNLSAKIDKVQENINLYSDIGKLKKQMELKLANTNKKVENIKNEIAQVRLQIESSNSEIREIRLELERNPTYAEVKQLESELKSLLQVNETLRSNDSSRMMDEIKNVALESTKKYNQSLLGF